MDRFLLLLGLSFPIYRTGRGLNHLFIVQIVTEHFFYTSGPQKSIGTWIGGHGSVIKSTGSITPLLDIHIH
jgi:hypothetical protein